MKCGSIQCITYSESQAFTTFNEELIIVYNLENTLKVIVENEESILKKNDLIVINPNTQFQCTGHNTFYILYIFNGNELRSCFSSHKYTFICDSSKEFNSNYDRLKKILAEVLIVKYSNHRFMNIKLNQLFYDIVMLLLANFSIEQFEQSEKDLLVNYINDHYREELSLQEMGEVFHVSAQYFSKYFKKHVGVQFLTYLTDVRLNNAVKEVLFSDKRMINIAMDNGFSNINAFNRVFKEKYGKSPKEYRLENGNYLKSNDSMEDLKYAIHSLDIVPEVNADTISITVDSKHKSKHKSFWNKLINIGHFSALDNAQLLNQLKEIQSSLNFEYIRIYLDCNSFKDKTEYSFIQEEYRFTMLYDLNFKIWFTIDYEEMKDVRNLCDYLKKLLSLVIGQWSIHNIQKWYFEISYNSDYTGSKPKEFFAFVDKIYDVLKRYGCEERIVIAGLALWNREGISNLYRYLEKENRIYKNQSFSVEPVVYYRDQNGCESVREMTQNDVHSQLLMLEKKDPYYKNIVENTFIVSWKNDLRQLNIMNDSCYKGALTIYNFLQCFGQTSAIAENVFFDSIYETEVKKDILFGGEGVISCHGIKKPSYYAHYFMSYVGNWFLGRNDNVAVFTGDSGNYHVVAHNYKKLSYRYHIEETNLQKAHMDDYFENNDPIQINICIKNCKKGKYKIKKRYINSDSGSAQDVFYKMIPNSSPFLHPHDIEFLKSISIPHLYLYEVTVDNDEMNLEIILQPNEIVSIHVIREF